MTLLMKVVKPTESTEQCRQWAALTVSSTAMLNGLELFKYFEK